jgi:Glycosyltransferase family 87
MIYSAVAKVGTPTLRTVIVGAITLLALGLRLASLARLDTATFDDGVYFGDSVALVHGELPYRDFVAVHPPLIMLIMSPVAGLAGLVGTAAGFEIARVVSLLAGVAIVPLLARLVRGRGLACTLVTCAVAGLQPDAVRGSSTLFLEPWLVLFCVLGLLVALPGGRLATGRRLVWGGVLFGLAAVVKIWAVGPLLALAGVLLVRRERAAAGRVVAGAVAAAAVVLAPFLAVAGSRVVGQVILAQLARTGLRTPLALRLSSLLGLNWSDTPAARPLALVAAVALLVGVGAALGIHRRWRGGRPDELELVAVTTTLVALAMVLVSRQYYYHYAEFVIPFAAVTLGCSVGRVRSANPVAADSADTTGALASGARRGGTDTDGSRGDGLPGWQRWWVVGVLVLLPLTDIGAAVTIARLRRIDVAAAVRSVVPSGSCVVTNQTTVVVSADRFVAGSQCRPPVDSFGTVLYLDRGGRDLRARQNPAVRALWLRAVQRADAVVWTPKFRDKTPIGYLSHYVRRRFRLVLRKPDVDHRPLEVWLRR